MSFGLAMQGLEEQIAEVVRNVRSKFEQMTYIEIGVANGETLAQVAKLMSGNGKAWRAVGVELPEGYSFHKEQVEQNCVGQMLSVGFIKPNGWNQIDPVWNRVSVVLTHSADFFEGMWQAPIHVALIDGCHCKECVMRDFTNVEKHMPDGGAVMLHDCDLAINDPQPHGGHCDVVGACVELGIFEGKRTGWGLPRIMAADHTKGGANMLLVERKI